MENFMCPNTPIILYGTPLSQPVRAVIWLLLSKREAFDLVLINPGSKGEKGSRSSEFLSKNPGGTIPLLEEPSANFFLAEAHAILAYLCQKHRWFDLYPEEAKSRAKVDWYLHSHHRGARDASLAFFAPNVRKDLKFPDDVIRMSVAIFHRHLKSIESGWLASSNYLTGDQVSIADIAAYVDIGQLRPRFTNLFNFDPFPNISRWMESMERLDMHDEAHAGLIKLGDISRNSPDKKSVIAANKYGYEVIYRTKSKYSNLRTVDPA